MTAAAQPEWRRALAVGLALALFGLGAVRAVTVALGNLSLPGPVFAPPPRDPAPVVVTPPRRVLVILVDGLRDDVARGLPFVRLLAHQAHAGVWAGLPSYSAPQYLSSLSGVPPADSGIRGNATLERTPLDNVPARVRAAGRKSVEIGDEVDWWQDIFGDDFTSAQVVEPEDLERDAMAAMPDADFLLVHLTQVDSAGHQHGADSPEYARAASVADAEVARLALAWGWPFATVVVFADHGHAWPLGGHGGDEPDVRRTWLVASGPGVAAHGRVDGARMMDLAPTLAVLAGVPVPAEAEGTTLVDLLALDPAQKSALAAGDAARWMRLVPALAKGRAQHAAAEQRGRLRRGLTVILAAALMIYAARRLRPGIGGVVPGLICLGIIAGAYALVYGRLSFSVDRAGTIVTLRTFVIAGIGATAVFASWITRAASGETGAAETAACALRAVLVASVPAAVTFVLAGAFTPRFSVEPTWLAAAPMIVYAAFASLAVVAAGTVIFAAAAEGLRVSRPRLANARLSVQQKAFPEQ